MISSHEENIELPAEWEAQSGILLTWPHAESDWKADLDDIAQVYIEMCHAITRYEKLLVVCYDQQHKKRIESVFSNNKIPNDAYHLTVCKTNDTWCRDYGPITVRIDGSLQLQNFIFNSWGNKYQSDLDNAVSWHLYKENYFDENQMIDCGFILEGGSIESDGQGTILTTSHCLLKRHPDKTKTEVEELLKQYLGATLILWLDHGGITGDDTDSHIDNLARFVNKHTIIYSTCHDESHPDYDSLQKMEQELRGLRQANGDEYNLIPLPLPHVEDDNGKRLPASYVNFLIINGAVLVPIYDDPQDKETLEKLQQCFTGRNIIGIRSKALVKQFGGIHCASMQFPAGVLV